MSSTHVLVLLSVVLAAVVIAVLATALIQVRRGLSAASESLGTLATALQGVEESHLRPLEPAALAINAKFDEILSSDQKKQFARLREEVLRGGPSSPGKGRPPVPDAFGPTGGSSVFRAYRYGHDYAGLVGKNLPPEKTSTTLHPKESNGRQAR